MLVKTAEFITSATRPPHYPPGDLPEIAVAGRSNVGKSSLINSLLHRNGLAKVSKTPGKTRAVNLFRIATSDPGLAAFYLVDLPGYGYAKVSKSIRAEWGPLIDSYVAQQPSLLTVILLVECRVVTEQDRQTVAWLRSIGREPLVVATKVDKLRPSERVRTLRQTHRDLGLPEGQQLIPYSVVTGEGRDHLWGVLRDLVKT